MPYREKNNLFHQESFLTIVLNMENGVNNVQNSTASRASTAESNVGLNGVTNLGMSNLHRLLYKTSQNSKT